MNKLARRISTGDPIELYSGGTDAAIIANAVVAGHPENDVEVVETSATAAELFMPMTALISAEAERRLRSGTAINGVVFKTEDRSFVRLGGLIRKAKRKEATSQPVSLKFRTDGGDMVTITSSAQAEAIRDAADDFGAHILATSATLQAQAIAGTLAVDFDPADDVNWNEP